MNAPAIQVFDLTKDFGKKKGVFDVSFSLMENEFVAIMGESGAGKTTLMRLIMDFVRPDSGKVLIEGKELSEDNARLRKLLSYVPGEINYPDLPSGKAFLLEQMALLGKDTSKKADALIQAFQLDVRARPRRMSKGMKEKLALVSALMADCPILLMDEPTNGLDPLMREEFLRQMKREKAEGKTLLLVSNDYEEIEALCQRAIRIEKGKLVDVVEIPSLNDPEEKVFQAGFAKPETIVFPAFVSLRSYEKEKGLYTLAIDKKDIAAFVRWLSSTPVLFLYEKRFGLRDYFSRKEKSV